MAEGSTKDRVIAAGMDRTEELREIMAERILVLDGATGTMLQSKELGPDDFGGAELEGCNEVLVRTRPDVILDVHRAYLAAGADIIETNTFGANSISLADYQMSGLTYDINLSAAKIARNAVRAYTTKTPEKACFVAGAIGPTNRMASMSQDVNDPGARAVTLQ